MKKVANPTHGAAEATKSEKKTWHNTKQIMDTTVTLIHNFNFYFFYLYVFPHTADHSSFILFCHGSLTWSHSGSRCLWWNKIYEWVLESLLWLDNDIMTAAPCLISDQLLQPPANISSTRSSVLFLFMCCAWRVHIYRTQQKSLIL